ncbi:cbb3-type cytochrome oxidase subunit 3 [Ideonella sp. YS5]|uniref:cbb3-type cytochrome oxidase subunit 3 n=1 Tax=Ideonella sp. YS5 TaxID=3453714 RepID=UPI003EE982C5
MDFDVNTWRSFITVLSLGLFLGLMAWTLNRRRQSAFDEAANLPFSEEPGEEPAGAAPLDAQRSNKQ